MAASERKAMIVAQKFEMAARGEIGTARMLRNTLEDLIELSQSGFPSGTISQWSEDWLERRKTQVDKSSYGAAVRALNALKDYVGHEAKLSSIHPKQIQSVLDNKLKSVAPGTVIKWRKILSKCFNDAVRAGLMENNPVAATVAPKDTAVHRVDFTDKEISQILDNCDDEWRKVVIAALDTGLRQSDVLQLGSHCYDKKQDSILFTASKNGMDLTIPVTPRLREILLESEYIAPNLMTEESGVLGVKFAAILDRAKIDRMPEKKGKNVVYKKSFHSLRHTFISKLANAGVDPEIRKKLAGHKSSDVHEIYTHHNLSSLREAIGKIG